MTELKRGGKPLYEYDTVPVKDCTLDEIKRREGEGWEVYRADGHSRSNGIRYRHFRRVKRTL